MDKATPIAVGIDLGTTYSCVAHVGPDGKPVTIRSLEGELTTPSVVFFEPNGVVVGKEAMKAGRFDPDLLARFAKRDVGRASYHRAIRGEKFPPEVIQALILHKIRQDAEAKLPTVKQAVVTVPAFFNEPRRKSTQDAGRLAGLEVLDIINEPTAAAIAYGVQRGFLSEKGESHQPEKVLVYDLGGGTFDATLMEIEGRNFNALATVGDVHLGGLDWDRRIADWVAEQFLDQFGKDPRQDSAANQALLQEAEDAKHALTAREEVVIHFQHEGSRMRCTLTRTQFETLTTDLLERTRFTVHQLLRDSGLLWTDITRLLLTGGSTRMPMVKRMLERESGLKADCSLSPDEAVAHGAALYAHLLLTVSEGNRPRLTVRNVNSHDLGVLGFEGDTHRRRRKVLIPRNTPLPATGKGMFLTQRENQPNIKVDVIEGGDASGNGATPIGKCVIDNLPPGLPGKSKIQVLFSYATNGRLTIRARLPDVDREATLTIERSSGLSELMLQYWEKRIREGFKETREPPPVAKPIAQPRAIPKPSAQPFSLSSNNKPVPDMLAGEAPSEDSIDISAERFPPSVAPPGAPLPPLPYGTPQPPPVHSPMPPQFPLAPVPLPPGTPLYGPPVALPPGFANALEIVEEDEDSRVIFLDPSQIGRMNEDDSDLKETAICLDIPSPEPPAPPLPPSSGKRTPGPRWH